MNPSYRLPRVWLAAAVVAMVAACGGPSTMDQTTRDFLAYDACKEAVSQQLKAPGSADFQSRLDVDYTTSGGDNITVAGWVDAQNSYGAKLRTSWACSTSVDQQGNVSGTQAQLSGS